jgi:formamidopyrimidine-DNA glycosylase
MRLTPLQREFTWAYFEALADAAGDGGKRSVKGFLTQEQLIPGLGNAIAQDIVFNAGLHPRRAIGDLGEVGVRGLYDAISGTVCEVTAAGGRDDEFELFGQPGGYRRLMSSKAVGAPCPRCGALVQRMQYLGGACYFCPQCQR